MNPVEAYKKRVRHEVMKISVSLISFYAVYTFAVVVTIVVILISSGEMSRILSSGEVSDFNTDNLPMGWLSIIALFVGSFMMLIVRGKRLFTKDLTKTSSKINLMDFFKMLWIILGINAIITLVSFLLTLFLESVGYSSGSEDVITSQFMDFSGILYVVILGPILEEIIFRGALLRALEPFGQNFAIVVSSLAFGLYHLMLFQGIFAFFVGIILGYCAIRFSIKWAMILHMVNNAFAMLISYVDIDALIIIAVLALLLGIGVFAGISGFKHFKYQLRAGKPRELHFVSGVPIVPCNISPADYRVSSYISYAMRIKARPYHLTFSSAWLLVALSIASLATLVMTFAT